jgi:hypothetical protein
MAKRNNDTFDLECPCCRAKMTVDHALGAVLAHVPPPKAPPSMDLDDTARLLREQAASGNRATHQSSSCKFLGMSPPV